MDATQQPVALTDQGGVGARSALGPATLRLELIDNIQRLSAIAASWDTLVTESATPELMLRPHWMLPWWTHYGEGRTLAVGALYDGATLVGLLPFCSRIFKYRPGIPFRRLEILGSSGLEEDGVCGEYLSLIALKGREAQVAHDFCAYLAADALGAWDECVLELVTSDRPMTTALLSALTGTGLNVEREPKPDAYYVMLPKTWDAYLKGLNSKRRAAFKRAMSEFTAWVGERGFKLERAHDAASLQKGLQVLADLHGERWQVVDHVGVFAAPRFAAFHREFAADLLARDELDLLWLTVGGEPVAGHYSFVSQGRVYFYQSGRSMDPPRVARIGIIMVMLAMQDAIERGRQEYDLMGGENSYKNEFTHTTRKLEDIRISRATWKEGGRRTLTSAVRSARKLKGQVAGKIGEFRNRASSPRAKLTPSPEPVAPAKGKPENT